MKCASERKYGFMPEMCVAGRLSADSSVARKVSAGQCLCDNSTNGCSTKCGWSLSRRITCDENYQ